MSKRRAMLDGGHTPCRRVPRPDHRGWSEAAGVFRKGLDDALDDLVLVAHMLEQRPRSPLARNRFNRT